ERRIQLVHAAVRFHARRRLGHSAGTQEPGAAIVAGAGVDLHARENRSPPAEPQARRGRGRLARLAAFAHHGRPFTPVPRPGRFMSVRDELPSILRGETAAQLDSESRSQLEALAADAQSEGLVVLLRDECAARLRQAGAIFGVEYLLALACLLHGERERALQTLLTLGDRLAAAKRWEALAAVAEHALDIEETAAGARLLVKAHEGLKKEPARIEALQRAWAIL